LNDSRITALVAMAEKFDKHILKNGMVLLGERMEAVESVAFDFMLPAGAAVLAEGCCGAGNVIADWIFRGAGDRNSRQLGDALDGLGLHRAVSVGSSHITIGAALEASNLVQALDLYADIILRPSLKENEFELAKQLAIDGVYALDDDPRQKVMLKLREQFYPHPLGRSILGDIDELKTLTDQVSRDIIKSNFDLSQTIFAVAGKYNFDAICRQMENLFKTDEQKILEPITLKPKKGKYTHINEDCAQVHIGLMTDTVTPTDDEYYNARMAISVLSGGMSARLFTEIREKRGLCYAIGARYHNLRVPAKRGPEDKAGIMCYAGTTPEKAQEMLDCVVGEFHRLSEGISKEEIERAKVGLKSALILQSESSSSRAGAIGSDYYVLGRVRSLDEIKDNIEATNADSVLRFLRDNKFRNFTIVTIGPRDLTVN
jgi:predicted Zn-dependent peptidase